MIKRITCKEFRRNILNFIEDHLDPILLQRLVEHVTTCKKCSKLGGSFVHPMTGKLLRKLCNSFVDMMSCRCLNSSTRLEYAKGGMTKEEREKVRDHTKNCPDCRGLIHAEIKVWETANFQTKNKGEEENNFCSKSHKALRAPYEKKIH